MKFLLDRASTWGHQLNMGPFEDAVKHFKNGTFCLSENLQFRFIVLDDLADLVRFGKLVAETPGKPEHFDCHLDMDFYLGPGLHDFDGEILIYDDYME